MDKLQEAVLEIARRAGEKILAVYRTDFSVEHKEDDSPVTQADLAAHHEILDGLRRIQPELPVLSEESAHKPWSERRTWGNYWLVDPLDGTREFVKRNDQFTVNIALIENHRPTLGAIVAPALGQSFCARSGGEALRFDGTGTAEVIHARIPARTKPVVAASRSHGSARTQEYMQRLGAHEKRAIGSSLKFCIIAAGEADIYLRLGKTSEWDTAAGQCILETAGGVVMDLTGKPLRYNTKESLINPEFLAFADSRRDWTTALPL